MHTHVAYTFTLFATPLSILHVLSGLCHDWLTNMYTSNEITFKNLGNKVKVWFDLNFYLPMTMFIFDGKNSLLYEKLLSIFIRWMIVKVSEFSFAIQLIINIRLGN